MQAIEDGMRAAAEFRGELNGVPVERGIHCMAVRGYYIYVILRTATGKYSKRNTYTGGVYLVKREGATHRYEYIDECDNPPYYAMPIKMLATLSKLVPDPGENALRWRREVRARYEARMLTQALRVRWSVGDIVSAIPNLEGTFSLTDPWVNRRGWNLENVDTKEQHKVSGKRLKHAKAGM